MYDCVIIGGGIAGCSAALYAKDLGLNVLIVEELSLGGQSINIAEIDNYPGLGNRKGLEFSDQLEKELESREIEIINDQVTSLEQSENQFTVTLSDSSFSTKTVILASGGKEITLDLDGVEKLIGRGLSTCATCDGPMFRDKAMMVLGGGDSACEEALFLSQFTENITIVCRSPQLHAQASLIERVKKSAIPVLVNSELVKLNSEKSPYNFDILQSVVIQKKENNSVAEITQEVSGLFLALGTLPRLDFLQDSLLNRLEKEPKQGRIITSSSMETKVPGLFAAGEIRNMPFRQMIVAASDGAIAAHSAFHYCKEKY